MKTMKRAAGPKRSLGHRVDPEVREMLDLLAKRLHAKQTFVLELAIRQLFNEMSRGRA